MADLVTAVVTFTVGLALAAGVLGLAFITLRGLWRLITGVDAHHVVHTAGALTGTIQRQGGGFWRSFMDGFRGAHR